MKSMSIVVLYLDVEVPTSVLRRLGANRQLMLVDYNHATSIVKFRDIGGGRNLGFRLMSLQRSLKHAGVDPMFTDDESKMISAAKAAIA